MLRILVDSSADFEQDELEGMECIYMPIQFGEESFNPRLPKSEFYKKLVSSDVFPKTSTPSLQSFMDIFEDVKKKGDEMIYISLSSGLSSTYQNACLAKDMVEYDGIYVFDTRHAVAVIRILSHYAVKLRDEGKKASEIVEALHELREHCVLFGMPDTLEYLYKGGRLSKVAATVGNMASLKPIVIVNEEGKLVVVGTALGKVKAYGVIEKNIEKYEINENFPFYVLYSYDNDNAQKLQAKIEKAGIKVSGQINIGSTIGAHFGPNGCGVAFVEKY